MKKLSIPISTFDVSYNLLAYPRSKLKISRKKANCQLFIYNLLDHFGYKIPMFRSSEIWKDKKYTIKVGEPRPLDILLFNKTMDQKKESTKRYRIGSGESFSLFNNLSNPGFKQIVEIIDNKIRITNCDFEVVIDVNGYNYTNYVYEFFNCRFLRKKVR